MQTRDRDQVIGTGGEQGIPAARLDALAVTDGQRLQDAAEFEVSDRRADVLTQRGARPIERRTALSQPHRLRVRAHVAGGAQALEEQPASVVEPAWILEATRALQAHGEAPALPRSDAGLTLVIPGQANGVGQNDALTAAPTALDDEAEAFAAVVRLNQAGDPAFQRQVGAGQVRCEYGMTALVRGSQRQAEAEHQRAGRAAAGPAPRHRHGRQRRRDREPQRRQNRQPADGHGTANQGDGAYSHESLPRPCHSQGHARETRHLLRGFLGQAPGRRFPHPRVRRGRLRSHLSGDRADCPH